MKYVLNVEKNGAKNVFINTSYYNLRADCKNCFGFCCVALYFSTSEGFPIDKDAGKPCINLQPDFKCSVHKRLNNLGLKGCTSYDCFGAGQKVAQVTYGGRDWLKNPESAKQMFDIFLIMRQIHEMLWYLTEALTLQSAFNIQEEIKLMINETERLSLLDSNSLLKLDLAAHGSAVNDLTLHISKLVRNKHHNVRTVPKVRQKTLGKGIDFIGKDLRKIDLRGVDLRGAYLIAADLRGTDLSCTDLMWVDMRDADLSGADLTHSIFVTQAQINSAKGDSNTKLPKSLSRPKYWYEFLINNE